MQRRRRGCRANIDKRRRGIASLRICAAVAAWRCLPPQRHHGESSM
jgi:hypothetical protein